MNNFFARKYIIQGVLICATLLMVGKLFYIQIIDDSYILSANNNVLRKVVVYPARGIILDRNGKVLVQNEPVYDILVTPREVENIDTALFTELIGIDNEGFEKRMDKARNYSPYQASIFEKQLSAENYAKLQEHLYKFRGFYVQNRTVRNYPDSIAAQLLGYIQEVNQKDIERSNNFYRAGDYIGATGIERSYEEMLRGNRGVQNIMVDALNRPKGSFMDGKFDTLALSGDELISSLDKDLQKFSETLLENKMGSIVAIEPSSGEVLTMVSSPGYDPNLMVGRERGNNYAKLLENPFNPMFIRPMQASYPPGSIFKVISALTAQEAGVIEADTRFSCGGGYRYGRGGRAIMRCTHVHGSIDLIQSIKTSCNTYYGHIYHRMIDSRQMPGHKAYDLWKESLHKFGLGKKLGIDLPGEMAGFIPSSDYYTKLYGNNKWSSSFNISLSIGQGELGITPLQMANFSAIIANRGFYYRPHLVKGIGNKRKVKSEYTEKINAGVAAKYYEPVIEGMYKAVNEPGGTANAIRIAGLEMTGKTGTSQNPHGENHAVFIGFAPKENPKIAIAVFVENAGYGGVWAAPIGSMIMEKYLTDTVSLPQYIQDRIYEADLLPENKKEDDTNSIAQKPNPNKKNNSRKNKHRLAYHNLAVGKNEQSQEE